MNEIDDTIISNSTQYQYLIKISNLDRHLLCPWKALAMDSTPAPNSTKKQVVCDCSKCILKSFRNEHGQTQPGHLVSATTDVLTDPVLAWLIVSTRNGLSTTGHAFWDGQVALLELGVRRQRGSSDGLL